MKNIRNYLINQMNPDNAILLGGFIIVSMLCWSKFSAMTQPPTPPIELIITPTSFKLNIEADTLIIHTEKWQIILQNQNGVYNLNSADQAVLSIDQVIRYELINQGDSYIFESPKQIFK